MLLVITLFGAVAVIGVFVAAREGQRRGIARATSEAASRYGSIVESRDELRATLDQSSVALAVLDERLVIRHHSAALAEMLGWDRSRLATSHLSDLVPNDQGSELITVAESIAAGRHPGGEITVRSEGAGGDLRRIRARLSRFEPSLPGQVSVLVELADVTEEQTAERWLSAQNEILESIASGQPIHVALESLTDLIVRETLGWAAIWRVTRDRRTLQHVAGLRDHPALRDSLDGRLVEPGRGPFGPVAAFGHTITIDDLSSDPLWAADLDLLEALGARSCHLAPIRNAHDHMVRGVLAVWWPLRHVPTERERRLVDFGCHLASLSLDRHDLDTDLAHQTLHDHLTGLPNRLLLNDRLKASVARSPRTRSSAVVFLIDLDRFAYVNEQFGATSADDLLILMAHRISAAVRPSDTVARYLGDQFAAVCDDLSDTEIADVARRISDAVKAPIELAGESLSLTCSIGVASVDPFAIGALGDPVTSVLRQANAALVSAKHLGRARWRIYDDTVGVHSAARTTAERELRSAVQHGDIGVAFQPVVELATGTILSLEVLARWDHPERGHVAPLEFVTMAEETGLIHDLGMSVLEQGLQQLARWRTRGRPDLTMNANLSVRQLSHPDLVGSISRALGRAQIPAEALCLEITESVLVDDTAHFAQMIQQLRDLGVRLAVDDFGTGYSSLTYLQRFPFDVLKIDGSFIEHLTEAGEDRVIVSAIIDLAHRLGLRVIAERVETAGQLRALIEMGCDQAQGYFLGHPLAGREVCVDRRVAAVSAVLGRSTAPAR